MTDKWVKTTDRLPESGQDVLAAYNLGVDRGSIWRTVKAFYAARYTVEYDITECDDVDYNDPKEREHFIAEYDVKTKQWYLKESWYEDYDFCEEFMYYHIDADIEIWQPLPEYPDDSFFEWGNHDDR